MSRGFTEDDQIALHERTLARQAHGRVGLGFSTSKNLERKDYKNAVIFQPASNQRSSKSPGQDYEKNFISKDIKSRDNSHYNSDSRERKKSRTPPNYVQRSTRDSRDSRERFRYRSRNHEHYDQKSRYEENTNSHNESKSLANMKPMERMKELTKRSFRETIAMDSQLGTQSTKYGKSNWERAEMVDSKEFFSRDECIVTGNDADTSQEIRERSNLLADIHNENVTSLARSSALRQSHVEVNLTRNETYADKNYRMKLEVAHHDAIFAPTGTVLQPLVTPEVSLKNEQDKLEQRKFNSASEIQISSRKGQKQIFSTHGGFEPAQNASQSKSIDEGNEPLYKTVQLGDTLEARYTVDDTWYDAKVIQVIHGGYSICKVKVIYPKYGNEETISWTRLRIKESGLSSDMKSKERDLPYEIPMYSDRSRSPERPLPYDIPSSRKCNSPKRKKKKQSFEVPAGWKREKIGHQIGELPPDSPPNDIEREVLPSAKLPQEIQSETPISGPGAWKARLAQRKASSRNEG